jgi:hypothetical protein
MTRISYAGYRFPPKIIQQGIWLYLELGGLSLLLFRWIDEFVTGCGLPLLR